VRQVSGRIFLIHHDIGDQPDAGVDPLEQVMAEQGVLRRAAVQAALEGIDVVDALAHIDAAAEQILIDVGDGIGVQVQADIAREDAAEVRVVGAGRDNLGAGLEQPIPAAHPARLGIGRGAVERMGQGCDERTRAVAAQDGIGVQGDDVPHLA